MEGTRTHSLRIVLVSLVSLTLGFFVGAYAIGVYVKRSKLNKRVNPNLYLGANTIMLRRMQAVKAAREAGRDTYEFEATGFYPIPGNKN